MRTIDRESRSGKIIRALSMGAGITLALANKRHSYRVSKELLKALFGDSSDAGRISPYLSKLRKQNIVEFKKAGKADKIILSENGQKILLRFNYEELQVKQPKIWDGNFRMIVFDIPERKRAARNSLREKIKELGFVKFNDSVWAYPYPCQSEIDFIANYWGIGRYVHFVLAKDLTNREILEKHFCL